MSLVDNISSGLHEKHDDKGLWLGHLCWYYVPGDFRITLKDWIEAIYGTDISDIVPATPRPVDAFKRAVAGVRGKQDVLGELTYKYLPRGAGQDEDFVYRSLTVEELDSNQHRLRYAPVIEFTYDRGAECIVSEELAAFWTFPPEVQSSLRDRMAEVDTRYARETNSLGPIKVRELIRTELEYRQQGIQAKPGGGVYFVFDDNSIRLNAVDNMVNKFEGCEFHQLPLINDAKQRHMLKEAFEADSIGQVDLMMGEMTDLLNGDRGKITMKKAKGFHTRFVELSTKLASYSDILEEAMEETGNRLKIMQQQCLEVVKHVG